MIIKYCYHEMGIKGEWVMKNNHMIAGSGKNNALFMENWIPDSLLVTLSHQGMALFKREQPESIFVIPTLAKEVFDVCGAGDTVIATYTLCMAAGSTGEEAAEIANHAAGIVVGKAGTAVTDIPELMASFHW